jgi:transposase-like protein
MTRRAYTAEEKETATSLALEHGVKAASEQTGVNLNSIRSWITRRQHGLPLHATPKVHERHLATQRPVSPPLPDISALVDDQGCLRCPRSLYVSVSDARGWFWADIPGVPRKKNPPPWFHRPLALWAVLERVNDDLPDYKWRDLVGICPRAGLDEEVLVCECYHESELAACLVDGRCSGHTESLKEG